MSEWDGQNRRGDDEPLTHGQHNQICKVGEVRDMLRRCGWGLLAALFGLAGWLIVNGGFARTSDLHELKIGMVRMEDKVNILVDRQTIMDRKLDDLQSKKGAK